MSEVGRGNRVLDGRVRSRHLAIQLNDLLRGGYEWVWGRRGLFPNYLGNLVLVFRTTVFHRPMMRRVVILYQIAVLFDIFVIAARINKLTNTKLTPVCLCCISHSY